jgi:hypothetical protein
MNFVRIFYSAASLSLALIVFESCTPSKTKDTINSEIKVDTIREKSITGKVLFKIKLPDFFVNRKGERINSVDELRNYVPVSFYEKGGHFYIPNRLDNMIYKIDHSGKMIEKFSTRDGFDIVEFYITDDGENYILNPESGLFVYSKENILLAEDKNIVSLRLDVPNDNILMMGKTETKGDLFFTDAKKVMKDSFPYKENYCEHYFNDKILLEMCYEEFTNMGLKERSVFFRQFDLRTLKPILENSIMIKCRHCFSSPKLLSEKWIATTNFNDAEKPFDELYLIGKDSFSQIELKCPIQPHPIVDFVYGYMTNLGFVYSLDKVNGKLYSLGTTEKEVVVIEYQLPDH